MKMMRLRSTAYYNYVKERVSLKASKPEMGKIRVVLRGE
jgi:hypothetical protein